MALKRKNSDIQNAVSGEFAAIDTVRGALNKYETALITASVTKRDLDDALKSYGN